MKSSRIRKTVLAIAAAVFLPTAVAAENPPASVVNSLGMKFVLIQPGVALIGSPDREPGRRNDEGPQVAVPIDHPFYLGAHEATVAQFRKFVEATGYKSDAENGDSAAWKFDPGSGRFVQSDAASWRDTGFPQSDDHPVVNVSLKDAMTFCAWLSKSEGKKYRLPSEPEWEYACRAGTTTAFSTGEDPGGVEGSANVADASLTKRTPNSPAPVPWDDRHPFTAPAGSYRANPFKLYDMHGNVWEWCLNPYFSYRLEGKRDKLRDRDALGDGRFALRGGSWYNGLVDARSASRDSELPNAGHVDIGFRVLLPIRDEE